MQLDEQVIYDFLRILLLMVNRAGTWAFRVPPLPDTSLRSGRIMSMSRTADEVAMWLLAL